MFEQYLGDDLYVAVSEDGVVTLYIMTASGEALVEIVMDRKQLWAFDVWRSKIATVLASTVILTKAEADLVTEAGKRAEAQDICEGATQDGLVVQSSQGGH